jgi:hypothetical protein
MAHLVNDILDHHGIIESFGSLVQKVMGTLKGFALPFGPPPATASPLASPFGDFGTCTFPTTPARFARALALGLARWYATRGAGRAGGLPTR